MRVSRRSAKVTHDFIDDSQNRQYLIGLGAPTLRWCYFAILNWSGKNAKRVWEQPDERVRRVTRLDQSVGRRLGAEDALPLKKVELLRLGRRIRRERRLLGLTQQEFATRYGLDSSYFGAVERGSRNITFGVLCTICDGLACDIAAITSGIPRLYARGEFLN